MAEKASNEIEFPDIRGEVLEIVIEYFYYKVNPIYFQILNEGKANIEDFKIPPRLGLEVLVASIYLQT